MTTTSGHTSAILASKVKGTAVYTSNGEKIGHVEDATWLNRLRKRFEGSMLILQPDNRRPNLALDQFDGCEQQIDCTVIIQIGSMKAHLRCKVNVGIRHASNLCR